MLHEFFGGGQITVSDFLNKNNVIAVDDLKNDNKTHLLEVPKSLFQFMHLLNNQKLNQQYLM